IAGLVVSGFIVRIALKLIRLNIGIIMDERPHSAFINNIKAIARETEGVRKVDSIKVHRRGSQFTIDLEVEVDSSKTVDEGHRIASNVRAKLLKRMRNIRDVMIHVNPFRPGG
ncbi:MAG: hypothetical protein KKA80_00915, partial [Candidatus Omnitrophica bacterium]|nr:hypothetical protein [Candidatus Omnitrophota bacterium]